MSLNLVNPSSITFGIGNAAAVGNGPCTLLVLWKPGSNFTSFVCGLSGATVRRGMLLDTDHLFGNNDFSSGFGAPTITDYSWLGLTLPGAAAHYRGHIQDYTAAGAWSHGEAVGAGNQALTGTSDNITLGVGVTAIGQGAVAVAGIWTSALSDAAIEAACTNKLSDFLAAQPAWAVRCMQSAPDNLQDLTSGGGNETARSGTITAVADPAGYDFTISAPLPFPRIGLRR